MATRRSSRLAPKSSSLSEPKPPPKYPPYEPKIIPRQSRTFEQLSPTVPPELNPYGGAGYLPTESFLEFVAHRMSTPFRKLHHAIRPDGFHEFIGNLFFILATYTFFARQTGIISFTLLVIAMVSFRGHYTLIDALRSRDPHFSSPQSLFEAVLLTILASRYAREDIQLSFAYLVLAGILVPRMLEYAAYLSSPWLIPASLYLLVNLASGEFSFTDFYRLLVVAGCTLPLINVLRLRGSEDIYWRDSAAIRAAQRKLKRRSSRSGENCFSCYNLYYFSKKIREQLIANCFLDTVFRWTFELLFPLSLATLVATVPNLSWIFKIGIPNTIYLVTHYFPKMFTRSFWTTELPNLQYRRSNMVVHLVAALSGEWGLKYLKKSGHITHHDSIWDDVYDSFATGFFYKRALEWWNSTWTGLWESATWGRWQIPIWVSLAVAIYFFGELQSKYRRFQSRRRL